MNDCVLCWGICSVLAALWLLSSMAVLSSISWLSSMFSIGNLCSDTLLYCECHVFDRHMFLYCVAERRFFILILSLPRKTCSKCIGCSGYGTPCPGHQLSNHENPSPEELKVLSKRQRWCVPSHCAFTKETEARTAPST